MIDSAANGWLRRLEPYPAYRPSGVEWLAEVPAHWEVKRFEICCHAKPRRLRSTGIGIRYRGFLRPNGSGWWKTVALNLSMTKALVDVADGYTYFSDGDVLVAKITPCFENGKGSLAEGLLNGIAFGTTELHVMRCGPRLDKGFTFYLTLGNAFRKLGEAEMYGAGGQKRVPELFVGGLKHPIPPFPEQRAIAGFLDRETSKIDSLVAKKERLIELLQEKRIALIGRAVTKGLDPNVPMKDSGVEWLGEIPAHWEVKRLRATVLGCQNGVWGAEPNGSNDIACVRVADFDRVKFRANTSRPTLRSIEADVIRTRMLYPGDLLLEVSGGGEKQPVGTVVMYDDKQPAVCSNFIAQLRPSEGFESRYLTYLHSTLYSARVNVRSVKQSIGIQNLHKASYLNEAAGFPTLPEQQAIAGFLDRETAKIDGLVSKIHEAIDRLKELRTAFISAAVTGRIDVREEIA